MKLFNNDSSNDNRGQVGIGTLIVFIALVLVAAIAAGVLINTAGFLQSQAESTGQQSTDQVANNIQVDSVIGIDPQDGDTSDEIDQLQLRISRGPGSDPVNLDNAVLEYVGTGSVRTTIDDLDTDPEDVSGSAQNPAVLDDSTGDIIVTINLAPEGTSDVDESLTAGDSVELTITTSDGSVTTTQLNVPNPITSNEPVRLA